MDFNIQNYSEGTYCFNTIRKQCEEQGLTAEVDIVEGTGVVVSGGMQPKPAHAVGDWYVCKDGVYSFMTPDEFGAAFDAGNVVKCSVVTPGKYTPVGIVAFDSNAAPDKMTRVMSLITLDNGGEGYTWGGDENNLDSEDVQVPMSDFNGLAKTMELHTKYLDNENVKCWAAEAAFIFESFKNDTLKWYLPAGGELFQTLFEREVLNREISKYAQYISAHILERPLWTVSEYYADHRLCEAWLCSCSSTLYGFTTESKTVVTYFVRPYTLVK